MGREFGEFLRARRDRLTPDRAGFEPAPGRRRVPGLRREEVAAIAGLSPDYLRQLEQGRRHEVSEEVLAGLARALRLDDIETAHLRDLGRVRPRTAASAHRCASQVADPGLLRSMAALGHLPVLILGRGAVVLAANDLLRWVLDVDLARGDSFNDYLFEHPDARRRIVNWAVFARFAVAGLRREVARYPDDAELIRTIERLRRDPQVEAWWGEHAVAEWTSTIKHIRHPQAGELRFGVEQLTLPTRPDQHLVLYTVDPLSRTARILTTLRQTATSVSA